MSAAICSISDARAIARQMPPATRDDSFGPLLREQEALHSPAGAASAGTDEADAKLRESAKQLVASALIVPVLESMQDSAFAAAPFAPGTAEKRFSPMLHWQIADRVTEASNFPLIDAVVDRMSAGVHDESKMNSASPRTQDVVDGFRSLDLRG